MFRGLLLAAFALLWSCSGSEAQQRVPDAEPVTNATEKVTTRKIALPDQRGVGSDGARPMAALLEAFEDNQLGVPRGSDVSQQVRYLSEMSRLSRELADDYREIQARITQSQAVAAVKILENAESLSDRDYYIAAEFGLAKRIGEIPTSDTLQQQQTFQLVLRQLEVGIRQGVQVTEVRNATRTVGYLERHGEPGLALEACNRFAALIGEVESTRFRQTLETLDDVARRLSLVGKPFELSGVSIDGKPIEWSDYQNKIVLVNFWAAWSGPCLAEIPELKRLHETYREEGFEILGISLDRNNVRLRSVIEKNEIPWVNLFHVGTGFDHPVATKYGVSTIPTAFLVGADGKVVTARARGDELKQQLDRLLGPE